MKINNQIKSPTVRIVGENVEKSGEVISTREAIKLADNLGLDLIEVNPTQNPPIAKIADYSKFLYEEKKKLKSSKKGNNVSKQVKFMPNISDNDLETKVKSITKFLNKGYEVKLKMEFRGRTAYIEAAKDRGYQILLTIADNLSDISKPESMPQHTKKDILMTLKPKK